ncbi:MAG TPA: DUF72 domain-containing protein [Cyanobacteria bacterium UBA11049]|nr:DUF72 domain-containing protein [Cyanobacteria bacterium UBA11049]
MNRFYPASLAGEQQLPFYAQHFSTVEINFSFYRLPERSTFETWRSQTPDRFLFAVKGSRYLTHMKKLKDPEEPLARLMKRASGLQAKLGPILFQFPRQWSANCDRLQSFLELLQTYPNQRYTFEFRHPSWLASPVYRLLEHTGAALCLPISPDVPLDLHLTAPWTYFRMHQGQSGVAYSEAELVHWAGEIRSFLSQNIDVYVYFNNDPDGHAIDNAKRLSDLLNR